MSVRRRSALILTLTLILGLGAVPFTAAAEARAPDVVLDHLELDASDAERRYEAAVTASDEAASTRTNVLEAPIAFTSLWVELPDGLDEVRVRTSGDGVLWSEWAELELVDELDAPDDGTPEARNPLPRVTDPYQAFDARYAQLEVDGAAGDLASVVVSFVDTDGLNESVVAKVARLATPRLTSAEASGAPSWINRRSAWGAAAYKGTPQIAKNGVRQVILHHTAGQNNLDDCSRSRIISTIRNIQAYHQNSLGWSDIGYNLVIDPCGGVWEGRAGGLDRAVIGAHAYGFNTGSTGISVLGDFTRRTPTSTILKALDQVVGWKAGIHGVNPEGRVTINGKSYPTVLGHKHVGNTACPGSIADHLPRIRSNAAPIASSWNYGFSDIARNTHREAIRELAEREIATGYPDGTYRPYEDVTRAQIATFLSRALEIAPSDNDRFSDVTSGNMHRRAINALAEAGILTGYDDGTFRPHESLRRDHMAVVIARALELAPNRERGGEFPDVRRYLDEIGAVAHAEIAEGHTDGTYRPASMVTRGQMATFLVRMLHYVESQPTAMSFDLLGGILETT